MCKNDIERIKRALFEKRNPNLHEYYKQKLDELYTLSTYCLTTKLSYIAGTTMLFPIYLASRHVCYSIQILNSVVKEVMLDPAHLPYNKYIKRFQGLAKEFYMAPFDETPIYYNESEWNRYDFQATFGDDIANLFPSFLQNPYWDDDKLVFPDYKLASFKNIIESLLDNKIYLKSGIIYYFEEISYYLSDILDYLESRVNASQHLKDIFKQRKEDYISCFHWGDARNEVYNEIRLLGVEKDNVQILNNIKTQYFYRLKNNRLGSLFMQTDSVDFFVFDLDDPTDRATQNEVNDFFKLHCQYELVCKILEYHTNWNIKEKNDLFINKGTEFIVNTLTPYLSTKIDFNSRKSYAALWLALLDLNLLNETDADSFKEWINNGFLKDAPENSSKGGKIKNGKSIRAAVDDLYKLQTKEGKQKLFKDLSDEEISKLKNGDKLKPLYRDCILILAKAFDINLENENFQPYIIDYIKKEEFLSDFPKDRMSTWILECFQAYEDYSKH